MPRNDYTGPNGDGPMTGRAMGYCGNNKNFTFGRGNKRVRGMGRGYGYFETTPHTLEEEKEALEKRLSEINKQLQE